MNKKISMSFLLFVLAAVTLLSSCTKDDDDDSSGSVSAIANVMAIHASPNSPAVDLYINEQLQNSAGLVFGNNSGYLQSIPGMVDIDINQSGTATKILGQTSELEVGKNYSVFVVDTLPSLSTIITEDDLSEPILGKSHIRLAHLSPDAPSVNIINMMDSSAIFANRSYKQISNFMAVDAGTYNLGLQAVGDSVITPLPSVTVMPGKIYTIIAQGLLSDTISSNGFGVNVISNTP